MSMQFGLSMVGHNTYNLELVLPKFFLSCLVKEWKVADMVDEEVP